MSNCPYCRSTRSTFDGGLRICEGCGAQFSLEAELTDVREELEEARDELRAKEVAPIQGRVADEDRYMVGLLRLQNRVETLESEEQTLLAALEER